MTLWLICGEIIIIIPTPSSFRGEEQDEEEQARARGVRQGDPLSCLLFNLAIEPLANLLRKSDLYGYPIPGSNDRLITTLFADDTTVYLDKRDNYGELLSILNLWCQVSGARFNVDKTEIIPIGSPQYRNEFQGTRRTSPENTRFNDNI
jgi:hypothetical protein